MAAIWLWLDAVEGAIADFYRIGAPGYLNNWGGAAFNPKVGGETFRVDGGRGDDDLKSGR